MTLVLRLLRRIGNVALWIGAGLGVVAAAFWLATAIGVVQPLIVISGSMEPGIDTGDLLIATRTDTADLRVGDVVSLPSELTGNLVTHRIIEVDRVGDGWEIEMQGDANPGPDGQPYTVGDEVWEPAIRLPGMGSVVSTIMRPSVTMPVLIAIVALLGMSLLNDRDDEDEDEDGQTDDRGGAGGRNDGDHAEPAFAPPGPDAVRRTQIIRAESNDTSGDESSREPALAGSG